MNALNENNSPVEKIIDRVVEDEKNGIRIYTIEKVIDGILERLELGADEYVVDQICKWTLSRGGIHSDEDYDRFQAMVEEAFGEGDEHGTYLGNLPLLKADRWYIDVSGIDPLDLPLPKWERDRQAAPPRTATLTAGEPAAYPSKEYVYGLFRRGALNILHGPSGVGKTRLLLELDDAARNGREYLGSRDKPRSSLFLLRDRLIEDYHETLESMGLPLDFVPLVELNAAFTDGKAAQEIADHVERHRPELLVVEGLDETFTSTVSKQVLIPNLKNMQIIARHYGCALVGTWGAPKRQSNPREMYANSRDAASGGADLARMSSSMLGLGFEFKKAVHGEMQRRRTGRMYLNVDLRSKHGRQAMLEFTEAGRIVEADVKVHFDKAAILSSGYGEAQAWAKEMGGCRNPASTGRRKRRCSDRLVQGGDSR